MRWICICYGYQKSVAKWRETTEGGRSHKETKVEVAMKTV